ncbi:MAG: PEGA domain-containing protein [Hyphomonadaceae bacterium]
MKKLIALALIAPIAACATITRGTKEAFTVESDPAGASVSTSLGHTCAATPCTFAEVPRESEFTVTVAMDGFETSTHNVTHQMSGGGGAGMAGNVILGGLIGAAIDANSGATRELVPNPLRVTLRRIPEPQVEASAAVQDAGAVQATSDATATAADAAATEAQAQTTPTQAAQ